MLQGKTYHIFLIRSRQKGKTDVLADVFVLKIREHDFYRTDRCIRIRKDNIDQASERSAEGRIGRDPF